MAQDPDQLRARLDEQRSEITGTVEQIENRIMPGRIMARRSDRMRRRLTDWKDSIFGNDEPDYPGDWYRYGPTGYPGGAQAGNGGGRYGSAAEGHGMVSKASEAASSAAGSVRSTVMEAPTMVRRQTFGNPMAAGVVALSAGWLAGSMLPRSRREEALARRVEPVLAEAATTVKHEGQELAQELREPVREAVEDVKETGHEVAAELRDDAKQAAGSVRSTATGSEGGAGQPSA